MTHGSLFSGIGGFDLAAEWMGWENVFHCEWNPFGQRVLKHYWPNAKSYHDITKTDFTVHRGSIDILTGGFPCQPYSMAGKRLGKADERHLFPEMLRAIKEIQPRWIIGENVRGLVSWNGGMVFDEVYADLESQGYEVVSFLIPAVAVNAPHRRDRVWFVAYAKGNGNSRKGFSKDFTGWQKGNKRNGGNIQHELNKHGKIWNASNPASAGSGRELQQRQGQGEFGGCDCEGNASDTDSKGLERECRAECELGGQVGFGGASTRNMRGSAWQNFPTVSPICNGDDGLSDRLDNITFSKWRNESIKAGGNAIVPQVALQIFKTIQQFEHEQNNNRQE